MCLSLGKITSQTPSVVSGFFRFCFELSDEGEEEEGGLSAPPPLHLVRLCFSCVYISISISLSLSLYVCAFGED